MARNYLCAVPAVLLAFMLGCGPKEGSGSASLTDPETEKKAIIQVMHEWAEGYVMRDSARLDRVRDDDWTYSGDPSGMVLTKKQADKMFQTDTTRYLSFDYDDLNVRTYGSAAVVTGREKLRWDTGGGKSDSASYRVTAVFVKRATQWRCVASHSSPITPGQ
jgi:ketosteroid isomerase-like protein